MIKPRHWSRAGIYSLFATKENRSKLLHFATLHYAIFSNHYHRPFCAATNRSMQNKPAKQGQKSTATQKGKTWHLSEKAKPQPCPMSCWAWSGNEMLILTHFISCHNFKRHTTSGANAAHVLPIIQK
jgi:hypothetical protein